MAQVTPTKKGNFPIKLFREVKAIDNGAQGTVWKYSINKKVVTQEQLDSFPYPDALLAVKKLKGKGRCCQREEDNLERLEHRNVVSFLGSYMDGENKCLVMELCDTSLEKYIEETRKVNREFYDEEIAVIIKQILEAVAYMHEQHRMLHRDLKAANVLVKLKKRDFDPPKWSNVDVTNIVVKLADLGLSRMYHSKTMTMEVGTEETMSPEMRKTGKYKETVDVFSIGVITLLMKTKRSIDYKTGMVKALEGVLWVEDFSLPLTLFLQATLIQDKDMRPGATLLLKHPFIKSTDINDSSLLFMEDIGGVKALETTDEFVFVRSVDGNLYVADPLVFSRLDCVNDRLSDDDEDDSEIKVTAMAAHKDKLALGTSDGRVQLWVVERKLEDGSPFCHMERLYGEKGAGAVAWVAINDVHLVCTATEGHSGKVRVMDISQKEIKTIWSKRMSNDPSYRGCSLLLSQSSESESILTWAEKAKVTQFILGKTAESSEYSQKETRLEKDFVLPTFTSGKDPIIECIAASATLGEHDLLWIATRNPTTVITKVNLKENKILAKFLVRGLCCQMVHLQDLLLCHIEDHIEVLEESELPRVDQAKDKRGSKLMEPDILDKLSAGIPRIHVLKDKFALYVDDNDVLRHYSKEMADKKKKVLLEEQKQAKGDGQTRAKK